MEIHGFSDRCIFPSLAETHLFTGHWKEEETARAVWGGNTWVVGGRCIDMNYDD